MKFKFIEILLISLKCVCKLRRKKMYIIKKSVLEVRDGVKLLITWLMFDSSDHKKKVDTICSLF